MKTKVTNRRERNQGMNWISQAKRLAIYLRDGLACAYCGATCEESKLTLDHLKPHSKGGSNSETNLVTCCHRCNSSRGNRSYSKFAIAVAEYLNHGVSSSDIVAHVRRCVRRSIDINYAKKLIALQGSCFKVLSNRNKI